MHPRTRESLKTAMEAEAYSSAKCSRFAAHARTHDNHALARLFQDAADADRCHHFQEEFSAAGLLGEDLDNAIAAMDEKLRQIDLYSGFRANALSDHDDAAAALFNSIHNDEVKQLEAFRLSIAALKATTEVPA